MCVHTGSTHICTCKNYVHMLYMYFILFQLFLVDFSLQFFPGDGSVGWADGDTGAGGEEETDDETGEKRVEKLMERQVERQVERQGFYLYA